MVQVTLPDGKELRQAVFVDEYVADGCFDPLPANREIPWEMQARMRAMQQKEARYQVAKLLGRNLAEAIVKAVELQDPVNGFSPSEWKSMKP